MGARSPGLVLVAVLVLAVLACGGGGGGGAATVLSCQGKPVSTAPVASAFPIEVEDDAGRTVSLVAPPQAIVSLSAGHTEILYAVGAGDQVIAVDSFSDCPVVTEVLPHVDSFSPSVEAIAALEPDLVIITFDPGGLQEVLSGLDIEVLFLSFPTSVEEVFGQVELLGWVTGHEDEAEAVAERMSDGMDEIIGELVDLDQGPTVFHELSADLWTVGPGSFVHDLYTLLKARNIAEDSGVSASQMNPEALIEADPAVIVLADEDAGASADSVAARPGWSGISAVQNGRVYLVDPDIVSRPGPRLVEALGMLARLLYPDRFE